ncbi:MAG: dNTP triphosphohydrolase [Lachnospiraceae bacterium]|nr:dNTP triphosphohydrolase [Lachnospiraceae bacterium]
MTKYHMSWTGLLNGKRPGADQYQDEEWFSPFERDYFTITTSSAFRRLKDKTQVYGKDGGDFVRTRLTHSLEVAAIGEMIGKGLAHAILKESKKKNSPMYQEELPKDFLQDLPVVLRCAGLLHDLGNPPYGHSGEEYIREWFCQKEQEIKPILAASPYGEEMWQDFCNFEGNAQNLRIATKLGQSSNYHEDYKYGMRLTYAVLGSIIKYPYSSLKEGASEKAKKKRGKIGYYHSEDWIFQLIGRNLGTAILDPKDGEAKYPKILGYYKNPIMLLLEAADDIAYKTADIEDSVKSGNMTYRDLSVILPKKERKAFLKTIESCWEQKEHYPGWPEENVQQKILFEIQRKLKEIRTKSIHSVIDVFLAHYEELMNGSFLGDLTGMLPYEFDALDETFGRIFKSRDHRAENTYLSQKNMNDILDALYHSLANEADATTRLRLAYGYDACSAAKKAHWDLVIAEQLFQNALLRNEMREYLDKGMHEAAYAIFHDDVEDPLVAQSERLYHDLLAITDFLSGMTDGYVDVFRNKTYDDETIRHMKKKAKEELLQSICEDPTTDAKGEKVLSGLTIVPVNSWSGLELATMLKAILSNVHLTHALKALQGDVAWEYVKDVLLAYEGQEMVSLLTKKEVKRLAQLFEKGEEDE